MLNDKKKIHRMKVHTLENDTVNLCCNQLIYLSVVGRIPSKHFPSCWLGKKRALTFFSVVVAVATLFFTTEQKLKIPSLLRSTLAQLILCQWKRLFANEFTCDIIEATLFIC